MAYCLIDGKVEQESTFETKLYNDLVQQLKDMKAGFPSLKTENVHFTTNFIIEAPKLMLETRAAYAKKNASFNMALLTNYWDSS